MRARPDAQVSPPRGLSSAVVAPVLAALRELGFQTDATLAPGEGTVRSENADPLFDRAALVLEDPAIALSVCERLPIGALGPIDYVLVASATAREGLTRVASYYNVVTDRATLSLVDEEPARLLLTRRPGPPISRHWVELTMAMFSRRLREGLGATFELQAVELAHAPPADTSAYERFFGVAPVFDAGRDALSFHAAWLDRPLRTAAATMADHLEGRLMRLSLGRHVDDAFLERAREAIASELAQGRVEVVRVAAQLGIAPRTLQRQLMERGTSHRSLLEDQRRERAMALLLDSELSVEQISSRLGFVEPTAFCRAFRKWTGMAPTVARRAR